MKNNINKDSNGLNINKLKTGLICLSLAFSLSSAMAQTDSTSSDVNYEKIEQVDDLKEQTIILLNNQLSKVNKNTYQMVSDNIKGFISEAYNVGEENVFIKRGMVPYKVDLYMKDFVLEYKNSVKYNIVDIVIIKDKVYLISKSELIIKN